MPSATGQEKEFTVKVSLNLQIPNSLIPTDEWRRVRFVLDVKRGVSLSNNLAVGVLEAV